MFTTHDSSVVQGFFMAGETHTTKFPAFVGGNLIEPRLTQGGRVGEMYCGYTSVRCCFVIAARKVQYRFNAQLQ
jgi:hypothetical protein